MWDKWEKFCDDNTFRMKVPGGWIVRHHVMVEIIKNKREPVTASVSESMVFVPRSEAETTIEPLNLDEGVELWEAINLFVEACGGDTKLEGGMLIPVKRELAVVAVEKVIDKLIRKRQAPKPSYPVESLRDAANEVPSDD